MISPIQFYQPKTTPNGRAAAIFDDHRRTAEYRAQKPREGAGMVADAARASHAG